MYESPIEIITSEIQNMIIQQEENNIFRAVRKIGVNVDKEELIKALKYDRKQYFKGFNDGMMEFAKKTISLFCEGDLYLEIEEELFIKKIKNLLEELVGDNK